MNASVAAFMKLVRDCLPRRPPAPVVAAAHANDGRPAWLIDELRFHALDHDSQARVRALIRDHLRRRLSDSEALKQLREIDPLIICELLPSREVRP